MNESLKIAKEELIERWLQAFDEIDDFAFFESKTVKIKYADSYRFDLKDYKNGRINKGGKLLDKKINDKSDYHEYGFDKKSFPTITRFRHTWNKIDWIGFYRKEKNLLEYIEFCVNSKVPSKFQRIIFENGKKISYQSLIINGGGSFRPDFSKSEILNYIVENTSSFFLSIQKYEYKNDIITKGYGLANTPGIGEFTFNDIYKYDEEKRLTEITRYYQNWPSQIEYIRPSGKSLKVLMDELSEMFVKYLLNVLLENNVKETLCYVVLNYQYCDNFWPSISLMTEEERQQAIDENTDYLFFSYDVYQHLSSKNENPKYLKEAFKEFTQKIEMNDNYEAGRKLLQKTARLLTKNKLQGLISVTDDFVAFPIDWTLTEDIGEILIKCGAKQNKVKQWKELNWF